ncbi:MAG: FAD-binding oxidoreductase [Mycobacteriales bacterium]
MTDDTAWDDYPYRVVGSGPVTPVIAELHLAPDPTALPYAPGQYVLLGDRDLQVPQRSYSAAHAPRPDGTISLLVTRIRGGATSTWVHDRLRVGDPVLLSGPYGTFVPDPGRSGPALLLAAGSGLAPVRALAEALLEEHPARPVTLFFSARTSADAIDHERLVDLARTRPGFRYLLTRTRAPDGTDRPHVPDLLAGSLGDLTGWEVFASGPPGFVTACAAAARALGAEPAAVHTEEFFVEPQPCTIAP